MKELASGKFYLFFSVVKICRIVLVTKMNSLYRNAQRFQINTHTRVETVMKVFSNRKTKITKKKVLKRVA